jgi:hypothetical protein
MAYLVSGVNSAVTIPPGTPVVDVVMRDLLHGPRRIGATAIAVAATSSPRPAAPYLHLNLPT